MPDLLVLGPLRVVAGDGAEVAPRSQRQRVLLAFLVARRDRVVSTDELIDALWGDGLPERPGPSLQSQIFRLRQLLGDADSVATEGAGYRLRLPPDRIDAGRFEDLLANARRHHTDVERSIGLHDDAFVLWRGRADADADEPEVVRVEAVRTPWLPWAAMPRRCARLRRVPTQARRRARAGAVA